MQITQHFLHHRAILIQRGPVKHQLPWHLQGIQRTTFGVNNTEAVPRKLSTQCQSSVKAETPCPEKQPTYQHKQESAEMKYCISGKAYTKH